MGSRGPGTQHGSPVVRVARRDEVDALRALRLEMLADTPHAFGDRLADVQAWDERRWQARLNSWLMDDSTLVVAADEQGRWYGQMGAREYGHPPPARCWLLEVYLSPDLRSSGVAAQLLAHVEDWVRDRGRDELYLDVHEDATAARRFYARAGFEATGSTQPYSLDPSRTELELRKQL